MPWISLSQLEIISCAGPAVYGFLINVCRRRSKVCYFVPTWISVLVYQPCDSEQFGIGFVMMLKMAIGQVE